MRYYMGRHQCIILNSFGLKSVIMHLENGYTGNKEQGYKRVKCFEIDVVPTRLVRRKKNE